MSVCSESAVYTLLAVKKAKQNFTIPYTQLPIRKCFFNCLFGYCRLPICCCHALALDDQFIFTKPSRKFNHIKNLSHTVKKCLSIKDDCLKQQNIKRKYKL